MPSSHPHDTVVLYNSKDLEHAATLVAALEQCGVRTWFAERDLQFGDPISSQIAQALERVHHAIVSIGANGLSGYLRDIEISALLSMAGQQRVKVVPIFVDPGSPHGPGDPPHYLLAGVKGIDCRQTGIPGNSDLRRLATQILALTAAGFSADRGAIDGKTLNHPDR